jgi:hypothetical protein
VRDLLDGLFDGLVDGLFDDAALFPPGDAPMAAAVPATASCGRGWAAWSGRSSCRPPAWTSWPCT